MSRETGTVRTPCEPRWKAEPPTYNKALAAGTSAAARLCDGYLLEEAA